MISRSSLLKFAVAGVLVGAVTAPAFAALQPLATFLTTGDTFKYTSVSSGGGTFGTLGLTAASVPATISFAPGAPVSGSYATILTLTGTASDPPTGVGTSDAFQDLSSLTLKFTGTGIHAGQNILTVTATAVPIAGSAGTYGNAAATLAPPPFGASAISILGNDPNIPVSDQTLIQYSSDLGTNFNGNPADYLSGPDTARSYSLSITLEQGLSQSLTNFPFSFDDVIGQLSGNFRFTPSVPEPGSVAMLIGIGMSGGLLGLRRMRRR